MLLSTATTYIYWCPSDPEPQWPYTALGGGPLCRSGLLCHVEEDVRREENVRDCTLYILPPPTPSPPPLGVMILVLI